MSSFAIVHGLRNDLETAGSVVV